jgi:acyl-CoA thioester hydrolase
MQQVIHPFRLELRIDWSEMDLFGHVNNVAFLKYIQASRVNCWETIGLTKLYDNENIGPMLVSTACQFKKQLHYPGNIVLQARFDYIRNSSFSIHHQILNEEKEVAAEAQDVIMMYDFVRKEKVTFPAYFREQVEKVQGFVKSSPDK